MPAIIRHNVCVGRSYKDNIRDNGIRSGRSMIAVNMTGLSAVGRKLRLQNRLFEADVDFEVLTNCCRALRGAIVKSPL